MDPSVETEWSDSYLVMERMIRAGDVTAAELRDLLSTLESQGLISAFEHLVLLQLAGADEQAVPPPA